MRILAVAVTFNPDPALLQNVLRAVSPQVQGVVVVDNASSDPDSVRDIALTEGATFVQNERNTGIAAAQNQGLEFARENGFSHILLLDQDTILSPGVVADLSRHLTELQESGRAIAAIGPAYLERHSGRRTEAFQSSFLKLARQPLGTERRPVQSDFIIASGALIPISAFEKVGTFDENLFIDLVDVDWCLRARAKGHTSYILPTASVDHHLGSGVVQIGGRKIAVHAPIRDYYWVRNALWLARQSHTPLGWKSFLIVRGLAFLITYTTMADKRSLRLKLMWRGIRDGISGRLGGLKL